MSNTYHVRDLISSTTKGITPKYVEESNVLVINQRCIRNNAIDFSFARYHDQEKKFAKNKTIKVGDILINSTGQGTAGRCAFVKELPTNKVVITDSHVLIVRVNSFYTAGCLGYSLFSIEGLLQTFMDGSTGQGEFDKERLFNIITGLPPKEQQEIVFRFLNNLDKKIELNNRINAELEAMAKTLYDYWFVQFDFPDANGKPYKSSGGKMVYNPTLKREIPEGWEVAPLSSITRVSNESIDPADYPEKLFKHFSIPVFDATNTFGVERGDTIGSNKFTVEETDLLVSKLNPWFNRVVYAMAEPEQICSTEFVVWRCPNTSIKNFMYMIATSPQFIAHCTQSATGTSNSHKRVNPNVMMRFDQPFNLKVAEKLGQHLEPILKQLIVNQRENTKLASLRDWLLPMLMNGQVTVK